MEPDGPEEWHVAPVNDGGFLDSDDSDDEDDDGEPWWEEADGGGGAGEGSVRRAVFGGNSPRLTIVVALAAAVLGVVAGLAFLRWPSASSPGAAGASASPGLNQNGGGGSTNGGLPTLSPLQGNGSGGLQLQLVGTVTAVSATSITVGGNGGSVTARFTAATKFSGQVRSPAGIKAGDQVAVIATGTPSKLTVALIQDPASGAGL